MNFYTLRKEDLISTPGEIENKRNSCENKNPLQCKFYKVLDLDAHEWVNQQSKQLSLINSNNYIV